MIRSILREIFFFSLLFFIFLPFKSFSKENSSKSEVILCFLTKVVDGDTVYAICNNQQWKIRLASFDAFEIKAYPRIKKQIIATGLTKEEVLQKGKEAKQVLSKLLSDKQFYCIHYGLGKYRRHICEIVTNQSVIVSTYMVCHGYGIPYYPKGFIKQIMNYCLTGGNK